jgi:hypothetical protein
MKIYCQKCGNGTEYSFDKPKFCSGCGLNFSIASSHISKIIKPAKIITQIEDEEEISVEKIPNISKLEFDIDIRSNKGSKLNNLIGTHNGESPEEAGGKRQKVDKQEVLENFKREAGFYPSRRPIDEEE